MRLSSPLSIRAEMARKGLLLDQLLPYDDPEKGWVDPMNEKDTQLALLRFVRDLERICAEAGSDRG